MDRKKHRIFWGCAAAVVLTAIIAFFTCFQITSVKVEGNQNYTEDEIKKMVLTGPLSGNTVLVRFLNVDKRTEDADYIRKAWIERTGSHTVVIHVREKELIGYVRYLDGYLYFDRDGVIQVSNLEALENIPYIEGVEISSVRLGEKLAGLDKNTLSLILSVTKMLEKAEQQPDRILLDGESGLIMYYGKVEVRLGADENIEEKISRMMGILPQLEGEEGVLHLENVDSVSSNVVFDKTLSEEEQKALDEKNRMGSEEGSRSDSQDESGEENDESPEDTGSQEEDVYDADYEDTGDYSDSSDEWQGDYEEGDYGW